MDDSATSLSFRSKLTLMGNLVGWGRCDDGRAVISEAR
jgi:hypothetical protein